jgi:hypothetical protein
MEYELSRARRAGYPDNVPTLKRVLDCEFPEDDHINKKRYIEMIKRHVGHQ